MCGLAASDGVRVLIVATVPGVGYRIDTQSGHNPLEDEGA
jgi:DNA-binding winged helix-turn-helix (wHTH) protein